MQSQKREVVLDQKTAGKKTSVYIYLEKLAGAIPIAGLKWEPIFRPHAQLYSDPPISKVDAENYVKALQAKAPINQKAFYIIESKKEKSFYRVGVNSSRLKTTRIASLDEYELREVSIKTTEIKENSSKPNLPKIARFLNEVHAYDIIHKTSVIPFDLPKQYLVITPEHPEGELPSAAFTKELSEASSDEDRRRLLGRLGRMQSVYHLRWGIPGLYSDQIYCEGPTSYLHVNIWTGNISRSDKSLFDSITEKINTFRSQAIQAGFDDKLQEDFQQEMATHRDLLIDNHVGIEGESESECIVNNYCIIDKAFIMNLYQLAEAYYTIQDGFEKDFKIAMNLSKKRIINEWASHQLSDEYYKLDKQNKNDQYIIGAILGAFDYSQKKDQSSKKVSFGAGLSLYLGKFLLFKDISSVAQTHKKAAEKASQGHEQDFMRAMKKLSCG